jgi:hypothetical protein
MLVLEVLVLVLIGEATQPLSAIFFLLFLEDFNLQSRKGHYNLTCVATDHLFHRDALIHFAEDLDILLDVDMRGPAVGNSEQHFLKHRQVHSLLASSVEDPFLSDFAAHLSLTVQR